jgi:hypothetical protein
MSRTFPFGVVIENAAWLNHFSFVCAATCDASARTATDAMQKIIKCRLMLD